jgi:PKD repeat protein/predicted small secreted protein
MKWIYSAAFAALCLLLSSCGTVRAIGGDFASDAPVLRSVTPTQVVSGQEVTFTAQVEDVTGDFNPDDDGEDNGRVGDVEYFWDFGGGAEPNTSTDPEPTVQIRDGQRSPYEATLTLTDTTGTERASETYEFTIFVTPLTIAAVTPSAGIAGGTGTFTAVIGSGTVDSWAWDFGGAASPGGSSAEHPTVTFTEVPGVYNGRVIVSNNFELVEVPFTVTVVPQPDDETP